MSLFFCILVCFVGDLCVTLALGLLICTEQTPLPRDFASLEIPSQIPHELKATTYIKQKRIP